jgi:hypothetical protein
MQKRLGLCICIMIMQSLCKVIMQGLCKLWYHCSPRRQQRRNVKWTRRMPRVGPRLGTKALPQVQGSSPSDRRQRSTRIVCQDFSQSNRLSTRLLSVAQGIMSCRVAIRIFLAMYHSVGMCFRDSLRMFSLRIVDMKIQGVAPWRPSGRQSAAGPGAVAVWRPRGRQSAAGPGAVAVCRGWAAFVAAAVFRGLAISKAGRSRGRYGRAAVVAAVIVGGMATSWARLLVGSYWC